jgi:DNA-directed RNA polymerase subunit RPC12/RpoP
MATATRRNRQTAVTRVNQPLKPTKLGTRAVERQIEPGDYDDCPHCGYPVKFKARNPNVPNPDFSRVVCNIYRRGKWNRKETFHVTCYRQAGEPHGKMIPLDRDTPRRGGKPASPEVDGSDWSLELSSV